MKHVATLVVVALAGCGPNESTKPEPKGPKLPVRFAPTESDDEIDFTTATESAERAARVLPAKATEDVSHLLVAPPAPQLPDLPEEKLHEEMYGPDRDGEWVIEFAAPEGKVIPIELVWSTFDRKWRKSMDVQVYGWEAKDKIWRYISAADGAILEFKRLAFGKEYAKTYSDDPKPSPTAEFAKVLASVKERAKKKFGVASVTTASSPEAAAARSRALFAVWKSCDSYIEIVLRAPDGKPFKGKEVWDVMLCVGLRWGDMDLFHWRDPTDETGDPLFSVATGTAPGYFLPEVIAAGNVRFADLQFGFSIPRSRAPEAVAVELMKAVEYARKRLGGTITDGGGKPLSLEAERRRIRAIVARLNSAGLRPGVGLTLRIF